MERSPSFSASRTDIADLSKPGLWNTDESYDDPELKGFPPNRDQDWNSRIPPSPQPYIMDGFPEFGGMQSGKINDDLIICLQVA
jgi:hypothetical protein